MSNCDKLQTLPIADSHSNTNKNMNTMRKAHKKSSDVVRLVQRKGSSKFPPCKTAEKLKTLPMAKVMRTRTKHTNHIENSRQCHFWAEIMTPFGNCPHGQPTLTENQSIVHEDNSQTVVSAATSGLRPPPTAETRPNSNGFDFRMNEFRQSVLALSH